MALKPNLPTPEGRALGAELARLCDDETKPGDPERCLTCAFRVGTIPNGCAPTLMDAIKCAIEGVAFYCHERPSELCAGWRLMVGPQEHRVALPWPFST